MTDRSKAILKEIMSYVVIIIVSVVIAVLLCNFVIINSKIPTGSMENQIQVGDHIIGFRLAYVFSEPQRGDVIIFKFPDDESQTFIKRIIGMPGDIVEIKNGKVYISGEELVEDYIKEPMRTSEVFRFVVPADSYFVMGDNRNNSKDSRFWEHPFVTREQILAKAIFRYWPPFKFIK